MEQEYESCLESIQRVVEEELQQYTRAMYFFGSYLREHQGNETGWIIPGTSDLDILLIVDTGDPRPEKPLRRLSKISQILVPYFMEPVYAPILDLTILEYSELPPSQCSVFNPIHLEAAAKGKLLLGRDVLKGFNFSEKSLHQAARARILDGYQALRDAYLRNPANVFDLSFLALDSVLDIAHTILYIQGEHDLARIEVPEHFLKIGNNGRFGPDLSSVPQQAWDLRLGIQKKLTHAAFCDRALRFCRTAWHVVRSPL
ncbi:MAG: hypothetical protein ACXAEI_11200 [Candidatus Hodarchaeales archaeon]|jgi:predicted nucleotidyltransferase